MTMKLASIPVSAITLRRVVFGTDFSEESSHALEYVLALNRNYAATIFITHVIDPLSFQFGEESVTVQKRVEIRDDAYTKLHELRARSGIQGPDFTPIVLEGEVSTAIDK